MYNFYQSSLRKDINIHVQHKEIFEEELFGTKYFGVIRKKKLGPLVMSWYQIMGVVLPSDYTLVSQEIKRLRKKYSNKWGNIFFQWGVINEIISFKNTANRSKQFKKDMKHMRLAVSDYLVQQTGLHYAFKSNMPEANIVCMIQKTDEELLKEMTSGCRECIRKSTKLGTTFRAAEPHEYEEFYKQWVALAGLKGFHTMDKATYDRFVAHIKERECGDLFVSELDGKIVAGAVCVYDAHHMIYLYGFASRSKELRNMGLQHFLKFNLFKRARAKGIAYYDLFGGAPTGFRGHPREGVSRFKESLGGYKYEMFGNFDIPLNTILYKLFAWKESWKKKKEAKRKAKKAAKNKSQSKKTTKKNA